MYSMTCQPIVWFVFFSRQYYKWPPRPHWRTRRRLLSADWPVSPAWRRTLQRVWGRSRRRRAAVTSSWNFGGDHLAASSQAFFLFSRGKRLRWPAGRHRAVPVSTGLCRLEEAERWRIKKVSGAWPGADTFYNSALFYCRFIPRIAAPWPRCGCRLPSLWSPIPLCSVVP